MKKRIKIRKPRHVGLLRQFCADKADGLHQCQRVTIRSDVLVEGVLADLQVRRLRKPKRAMKKRALFLAGARKIKGAWIFQVEGEL